MEFSPDILSVSGILVNAKAKFGDLTKVTPDCLGSQEIISYIVETVRAFLKSKNYLEDDVPKTEFTDYFENLSLFLAVNCGYSKTFTMEQYAHLIYNLPKISKHILSKVVVEINIVKYFCSAVEKLPLLYSCELFEEFLPCLNKLNLERLLQDTYLLLHAVAVIVVKNQDLKHSDELDKLLRPTPEFFFKLHTLATDHLRNLKKKTLYEQVGFLLKNLLNLLVYCNENYLLSGYFFTNLIETSTNIVQSVTLDMFIEWAEIDLESGLTLQNEIAEQAYLIVNKYENVKIASELIVLLKQFAAKPKDFKLLLMTADVDKMALMVNKVDTNQKKWFQALVFGKFSSNQKAIECISTWANLCDADDVGRVLKISTETKQKNINQLAVKCCSQLSLKDFIVVTIRHFFHDGFVVLDDEIQSQIIPTFNLLTNSESVDEGFIFKLLLFILQNPTACISLIFKESLSNPFYISVLKKLLLPLKDIFKVHNIGLNCVLQEIESSPIKEENSENFRCLMDIFLDVGLVTNETLIVEIINPIISDLLQNDNIESVKYILESLNGLNTLVPIKMSTEPFVENLFKILSMRTQFMNHRSLIQSVVREVVKIINNKVQRIIEDELQVLNIQSEDDKYISYYKKLISNSGKEISLVQHVHEDFSMENSTRAVCNLMQILPQCVTEEWISIYLEIMMKSCCKSVMMVTTDMMMLMSEFTQTQINSENYPVLQEALKYCVHQVGAVVQNAVLRTNIFIDSEIVVTEQLIRLLRYLPAAIKEVEGFNLVSLMTERSLKRLAQNPAFVTNICKIKSTKVCQIIAQKILA